MIVHAHDRHHRRRCGGRGEGLAILQEPTTMDFGRNLVAAAPDGHRLRVFSPA